MPHSYLGLATLKTALGVTGTAQDARLLAVLQAVAAGFDAHWGTSFRVVTQTRYFSPASTSAIRLDQYLLAVTALATDDDDDGAWETTWTTADYRLAPFNAAAAEQGYREVRTHPTGSYSFPIGDATVSLAGRWGYWQDLVSATTLAEDVDISETAIDVASGSAVEVGWTLLFDSEQVYVTSIASNTLTVTRAVNGTTAATHANGATVSYYRYPAAVSEAVVIQASRINRRRDAPFGVMGSAELGTSYVIARHDSDVLEMIAPYRLARV